MQESRTREAAGVFVLGGVVPLHPLPLLGRYKGSPPATQVHFSTMHSLLILAFVGAAGESHASLQVPLAPLLAEIHASPFLRPLLFYPCVFSPPWPAPLLPTLGLSLTFTSLTFCPVPLPSSRPSILGLCWERRERQTRWRRSVK
jgi:hypothetical protein